MFSKTLRRTHGARRHRRLVGRDQHESLDAIERCGSRGLEGTKDVGSCARNDVGLDDRDMLMRSICLEGWFVVATADLI